MSDGLRCKKCGSENLSLSKQARISGWGILFLILAFPYSILIYIIYSAIVPDRIDATCRDCGHKMKGIDHRYC